MDHIITVATFLSHVAELSNVDMMKIFLATGQALVTLASTLDFISLSRLVEATYSSDLVSHLSYTTVKAFVTGNFVQFINPALLTPNDFNNLLTTGSHIVATYGSNGIDATWYINVMTRLQENWTTDTITSVLNYRR